MTKETLTDHLEDFPPVEQGADLSALMIEVKRWKTRAKNPMVNEIGITMRDTKKNHVMNAVVNAGNTEAFDLILQNSFKKDREAAVTFMMGHAWNTNNVPMMKHILPKFSQDPPRGYLLISVMQGDIKTLDVLFPHYPAHIITEAFLHCVVSNDTNQESFNFFYNKIPKETAYRIKTTLEAHAVSTAGNLNDLPTKKGYRMLLERLKADDEHEALSAVTSQVKPGVARRGPGRL